MKDILQVLRDLLRHRTDDLGSYEFVLESWIETAADEIERLRAMLPPVVGTVPSDGGIGFVPAASVAAAWSKACDVTRAAEVAGFPCRDLSGWISVADRLPEPDSERMLLVCVECEYGNREVDICRYRLDAYKNPSWGDISGANATIYQWQSLYVTHWMPLPEPPEAK